MNDYNNNQNDQDNMNNGYDRSWEQESGGGYSYNYTPNNNSEQPRKNMKKTKKYIAIITASVVALIILVMAAASMGYMVFDMLTDKINDKRVTVPTTDGGDVSTQDSGITEGNTPGSSTSASGKPAADSNVVIPKDENTSEDGVTSAGQAYGAVTRVYNAVSDSVVEISTEIVQNSMWMGQYVTTGAGSGVIIHNDGYIVTNHHVIDGASNIKVTLKDGTSFDATFIGTDEANDIAVIKINAGDKALSVAQMGCSKNLVVGEDVLAIGNPLGSLGGTLTDGIISATERNISINGEDMVLLQTNAAINPGNSGGGLFNMAGQLIGIVNAKAAGDDVEGLGFAIPIDTAHPIIQDIINYGYVKGVVDHGISIIDVTAENIYAYNIYYGIDEIGAYVKSSAFCDELKSGDKILSVDGKKINTSDDVESAISDKKVGDEVAVVIKRNNQEVSVTLTLKEKVPDYVNFG